MLRCQKSYEVSRGLLVVLLVLFACSVSAQAQVTSLTMTSDAGDYIGGGQFYFYTPASAHNRTVLKAFSCRLARRHSTTGGISTLPRRIASH